MQLEASFIVIPQVISSFLCLGIWGDVFIDEIGDRIADYSLLDMTNIEEGVYEVRNRPNK